MAFDWMCVALWMSGVGDLFVFGLGAAFMAVFLRRAMRLICRVIDLVIGGGNLTLSSVMED